MEMIVNRSSALKVLVATVLLIGLFYFGVRYDVQNTLRQILTWIRGLAARGRSTFSELRWYPPMEAAKGSLSWVFQAKQPESVRTGP